MISALVIGFFGSFHCVGMCGPLMMTFIGPNRSVGSILSYHFGRILAYIILGLILGLIGAYLQLVQIQKISTLFIGFGLLVLYGVPALRARVEKFYYESGFNKFIRKKLTKGLTQGEKWFASGLANGFLPCGLTYVAAAGAIVNDSIVDSILFMLLFGLGTLPALIILQLGSSYLLLRFKKIIPAATTLIAIISGSILLLRGALMTFPDFHQLVQANAISLINICGL